MSKNPVALSWPQRLIPPLIDLGMWAGIIWLVPWLGDRIFAQSQVNHFFLIPGFFLILAGIIAIRQLPEYSLDEKKGPSILAACLVFFQVIIYSMLYAYSTNVGGDQKGNDNVAVVLFFIFLPLVLGAFFLPVERAAAGTGKALTAQSIGLISVNYLTLIGAAVWHHFSSLPAPEDPVYATGIWFLILFAILYLLFLAFFGLPRLYLLRATGDKIGLAIYLGGLAIFLWNKVPAVN